MCLNEHVLEGFTVLACMSVCVPVTTQLVASFISTLKLKYKQLHYGIL